MRASIDDTQPPPALAELTERALAWLADDPDPTDRAELRAIVDALPHGSEALADRFAGPLTFGTAGLRGPMRAGPNGMNLAVVRQAAAGLVAWLGQQRADGPLVIGFDARHRSRRFAEETARVATGAGRPVLLMPEPSPTPVLAYAVRALDACAGVMVTASHNPPADNGYKVYLGRGLGGPGGDGAQLAPPVDAEIEKAIRAVGPLLDVPLGDLGDPVAPTIVGAYLAGAVTATVGPGDTDSPARAALVTAYTALHGVGMSTLVGAFKHAGFAAPALVAGQAMPDPDFPTVSFPNPEEPGAMDAVIDLAAEIGADLAIANDPDADRLAIAVPVTAARVADVVGAAFDNVRANRRGDWRALRGDEIGVLIADHLIRRGVAGRFATTIVSSSLLPAICAARGLPCSQTLTGFKWIVRAAGGADLAFGYEEALGYCVAPEHVRDKDGITAALVIADLAATLKAEGRTLLDRLDEIAREFGLHGTDQVSIRVDDLGEIAAMMARLRAAPPVTLLDESVRAVTDLAPDADVVTLHTATARVVVRPSGTEPKLKAYLEVITAVAPDSSADLTPTRDRAATALTRLRAEITAALGHGG